MKIIHMWKFGPGKVAKTICLPVGIEAMPVGYKCTVLANKLQGDAFRVVPPAYSWRSMMKLKTETLA